MSKTIEDLKFLIRIKEGKCKTLFKAIERIDERYIFESREGKDALNYSKRIHENKLVKLRLEINKLQSALFYH